MNLLIWLPRVLPVLGRHWLALLLVLLLIGQQVQLWQGRRENTALRQTIEAQKSEMAGLRGAIQRLSDAAATLRPGETRTIYVDRPFRVEVPRTVAVPGPTVTREVPVVVTRAEKTIETRVETLQLPAKEIERIIREAPQSIVATMTALRDIRQGEQFSATFAQLQPGIWQPIVTPDSPVGIEAKVVTPVDRIPQPASPSRWAFAFLAAPDMAHPRGPTVLTRAEVEYRLTPRLFTRAEVGWHWNGAGASGLLLFGARF